MTRDISDISHSYHFHVINHFLFTHCTRNGFRDKNIFAVLFFRTGPNTFPLFKYETSTLSKILEAWQYSNKVFICVR